MSNTDLDNLPATPETDEAVAVEILKWVPTSHTLQEYGKPDSVWIGWYEPPDQVFHSKVLPFSTSISYAMRILDEFKSIHLSMDNLNQSKDQLWRVAISQSGKLYIATAPTMELAICRCALKVVRG